MAALGVLALPIVRRPAVGTFPVPPVEIHPRETWAQGRPPLGPMPDEDVRFLLVHHTAGETDHTEQGAIDQMRLAYDFHTSAEKGWPDVAYNFFVDRFGRVFEGRAGSLAGPVVADATAGSQGFAQLVCVLGDFTSVMPSDAALDALASTLAWLADRHGLDTSPGATTEFVSRGSNRWPAGDVVTAATISGHRDMSATACPGDTFYPYVRDVLPVEVDRRRVPVMVVPSTSTSAVASTSSSAPTSTSMSAPAAGQLDPVNDAATEAGSSMPSSTVAGDERSAGDEDAPVAAGATTPATTRLDGTGGPGSEAAEGDRGRGLLPWLLAGGAGAIGLGLTARSRVRRRDEEDEGD